jgi:hypothetical protein
LTNRAENPKGHYSPELKCFALNLLYYSNRGNEFVRKSLNYLIPCQRHLQRWYAKLDGSPGFTEESLKLLNRKILEAKIKGKKVAFALTMDEMHVRHHVSWEKCLQIIQMQWLPKRWHLW